MQGLRLSRRAVWAISAGFALLLGLGFWWKLMPRVDKQAYYRDAARLQAQEAGMLSEREKKKGVVATPPPSDKAYQPESGHID